MFTFLEYDSYIEAAQRLAAQLLGRFRFVVTILAVILKT
jgi:hypothetical protein